MSFNKNFNKWHLSFDSLMVALTSCVILDNPDKVVISKWSYLLVNENTKKKYDLFTRYNIVDEVEELQDTLEEENYINRLESTIESVKAMYDNLYDVKNNYEGVGFFNYLDFKAQNSEENKEAIKEIKAVFNLLKNLTTTRLDYLYAKFDEVNKKKDNRLLIEKNKVKTKVNDTITTFKWQSTPQALKVLFDELKGTYIANNTSFDNFEKCFSGEEIKIETPIQWTLQNPKNADTNKLALLTLIQLLDTLDKIEPTGAFEKENVSNSNLFGAIKNCFIGVEKQIIKCKSSNKPTLKRQSSHYNHILDIVNNLPT